MNLTSQTAYTEISFSNGKKAKIYEYMTQIGDIELEAIQGLHLLSEFFCKGFDSKHHNLKKRSYKSSHFSVGSIGGLLNDDNESPRKKKKSTNDIVDDVDDDYEDDIDDDFDDDDEGFNYESSRKSKKSTSQSSNRKQKPSILNEPSTDEWFDMIQRALREHAGNEATITELVVWLGKNVDFCRFTPVEVWKRKLTNLLGHHPRRFIRRDRDKNNPKESARPGTGGFWGLCKDYMNKSNFNKTSNTNSGQSSDSQSSNDSESSESDDKNTFNKEHALRPTLATADIIQQVLMSQSDKKGSCNEIFQWIAEKFPWFKTQPTKRWHHTVRHALSSYKDLFIHFSPKDSSYKPPRGGFYGLKQYYDKDGKYVGKIEK